MRHEDLTLDDEIATWNDTLQRLEYHKPREIMRRDYDGPMHYWKHKSVDAVVTPNMRMWVKTQYYGDWHYETSEHMAEVKMQARWRMTGGNRSGENRVVTIKYFPRSTRWGTNRKKQHDGDYLIDASVFAWFLGHWISEGSVACSRDDSCDYGIKVHQNKGPLADKMRKAMVDLDMGDVSCSVDTREMRSTPLYTFVLNNKSLWHWLKDNVGFGCHNKRIPDVAFMWPLEAQEALFDAMMEGDGSKRTERTKSKEKFADVYYATTSKDLADDVQRLCVQIGVRTSMSKQRKGEFEIWNLPISSKQCGYVNTSAHSRRGVEAPNPVSVERYAGVVWNANITNGIIVTRRNARIALHGSAA